MTDSEHRTFTRVPVHIRAEFRCPDGRHGEGRVDDLSINGTLLECLPRVEIGEHVELDLMLDGGTEVRRISTRAEVVRVETTRVGFHFLDVDGGDFEHLERLVLFNSVDAGRVEEELQAHARAVPPMRYTLDD